jgi:hypothetical protein
VYLYWGEIDKAGHSHGWRSREWTNEVETLDRSMATLRAALPATTALWVTADHGMVDTDPASVVDIAAEPALAQGVELVAGEARALHLYGPDPDAIAVRWRERLGSSAWTVTRAEAVALGLFGPVVEERVHPIVGDVVVAVAGTEAVVDSRSASRAALRMIGQHGSLTVEEMEVPLIEVTP